MRRPSVHLSFSSPTRLLSVFKRLFQSRDEHIDGRIDCVAVYDIDSFCFRELKNVRLDNIRSCDIRIEEIASHLNEPRAVP